MATTQNRVELQSNHFMGQQNREPYVSQKIRRINKLCNLTLTIKHVAVREHLNLGRAISQITISI